MATTGNNPTRDAVLRTPHNQMTSAMSTHWLFVDGADSFGGHEVMLLRWLDELRMQQRVVPIVMARAGSRLRDEAAWCAASEELPARDRSSPRWLPRVVAKLWLMLRNTYRDALSFRHVLQRLRPDLCIVAEGCLLAQPVFVLAARMMNVRTVVYVPLVESAADMGFSKGGVLRDAITRHLYVKLPQAWLTITSEQAMHLRAWTQLRTPVFTLPNTVTRSIEQFASQRWDDAHGGTPAAPTHADQSLRVLVLGRLDAHQKGLDWLLDYLEHTPSLPCKVQVSLVGEGPYAVQVRQRMQMSSTLGNVLSLCPWGRAVDLMLQHDVLLLASRFEGVPLVMLEAMALGLPVVASDLPGTRGLLPPDMLFPVGKLARAFDIMRTLTEFDRRIAVITRNREQFLSCASGAAFSSAVAQLTDQLLSFVRCDDSLQERPVVPAQASGRD